MLLLLELSLIIHQAWITVRSPSLFNTMQKFYLTENHPIMHHLIIRNRQITMLSKTLLGLFEVHDQEFCYNLE